MNTSEIVDAYISTRQSIYNKGIKDDFFQDLTAARLLIERVGESDNQDWWDSRVLSKTGRARLSEVTPNTRLKSQINLSMKIGRKAESDRIPDDSVSLFCFGPQIESQFTAAIEGIESDEQVTLQALENLSVQSLNKGWTDEIIAETESVSSIASDAPLVEERISGESYALEKSEYTQGELTSKRWKILHTLLHGYRNCTDRVCVPYCRMGSELKKDSA